MKIIFVLLALTSLVPAAVADEPPAVSDFCFIRQLLSVKTERVGVHLNPLFFDGGNGVFSNLPFPAAGVQWIPATTLVAGVTPKSDLAGFLSLVGHILASTTFGIGAGESVAYSRYCEEKFTQYHEEKLAEERLLGRTVFSERNR